MGEEQGVKWRKGACKGSGVLLLYFVDSFPVVPHRRRQLCVIELAGEAWREGEAGECN